MAVRDVAPDEWECKVFIAVAEHGTFVAAAKALSAPSGVEYGSRAVAKVITKIEHWLGVPAFEQTLARTKRTTARGEEFLRAARAIVGEYDALRHVEPQPSLPVVACMPHHLHVVARAEATLARRARFRVQFLERSTFVGAAFHRHVVSRLQRDLYQLIIGPPVPGEKTLVSKDLYVARLEAMVPAARGRTAISLTELVRDDTLFLPPPEARSRRLFEDRIVHWGLADPGSPARIERESQETATSVLRVQHGGGRDRRVVIAASDVALPFKPGREFAGSHAERFRWIPIYHQDADGVVHQLTQRVCVTVKRSDAAALFPIVEALRRAIGHYPELSTGQLTV